MLLKKVFFIFVVFIFSAQISYASEKINITISKALDVAVENNLELKALKVDIDKAKNNVKIANRLQNPNFDLDFFMGEAGKGNPWQLGPSVLIEIAKRGARKNLAKADLVLVEKTVDLAEFKMKIEVRKAYIKLLYAKTIYTEITRQKEVFDEINKIAKEKIKKNKADQADIIQTEIILNRISADLNHARANLNEAINNFNDTLNLKDASFEYVVNEDTLYNKNNFSILMTPELDKNIIDIADITDYALKDRFDIQISKAKIDYTTKNLVTVCRKRIPDIELSGGYAYQPQKVSENGNYKSGAYVGGSIVNLPIFYNYSPEIKNAKMEIEQAELRYNATVREAINDVNSAYEKFVNAKLNLKNYEDHNILSKTKELMVLSKEKYKKSDFDLIALIVMEQSYREILFDYTTILEEYYLAWLDLIMQTQSDTALIEKL